MASKTKPGLRLNKQVLTRMSEEEHAVWTEAAKDGGITMNTLVRHAMAMVLGIEQLTEDIDREMMAAKISRASHMRNFRSAKNVQDLPVTQRRAG